VLYCQQYNTPIAIISRHVRLRGGRPDIKPRGATLALPGGMMALAGLLRRDELMLPFYIVRAKHMLVSDIECAVVQIVGSRVRIQPHRGGVAAMNPNQARSS